MQTTTPSLNGGWHHYRNKSAKGNDFRRGIFSTKKPTHGTFYLAPFFATKWFCSFCSHDFEHWQSLYISVLVRASQLPKNPWSGRRKTNLIPKLDSVYISDIRLWFPSRVVKKLLQHVIVVRTDFHTSGKNFGLDFMWCRRLSLHHIRT